MAKWTQGSRVLRLVAALAAAALLGCANTVAIPSSSGETLLMAIKVQGTLDTTSGNLAYYFVIDTTPDPSSGPRCYGPAPPAYNTLPGANLPFFANPNNEPNVVPPLLQVNWTDYYVMQVVGGVLTVMHGQQLGNAVNEGGTLNPSVGNLVKGIDWDMPDASTVRFIIPVGNLNYVIPPSTPGSFPDPLKCNIVVANSQGQIVDLWGGQPAYNTFLTLPTTPGAITPAVNPFAGTLFNAANLPAGESLQNASLQSYTATLRSS